VLSGDLKSSTEVMYQLLEETIQTVANGGLSVAVDVGSLSRVADVDCSDNGFWLFQRGWCWSAHATELGRYVLKWATGIWEIGKVSQV